jgi:AcrR family transcriptional regulator
VSESTAPARPGPDKRPARKGKVGRPARLDREMIAQAAYEIGLDHVTMKSVAERLGVSVPGLYHHVEGRDDLMRLATEYSTARIRFPGDHGQQWPDYLMEWARHMYDAFVAQPEILNQFWKGASGVDRMVDHVDAVIGFLTQQGFTEIEALEAYSLVSRCVIGATMHNVRENETGNELIAEYHRALAARPSNELPALRRLVAAMGSRSDVSFEEEVATALIGIAVRRGDPWEPILDLVRDAPDADEAEVITLHP